MNSSIITEDELLKENKTKRDKAANNNRVEVKDEFEVYGKALGQRTL